MSTTILRTLALIGGLAGACNSGAGGVGAPCETTEDCEGELICDEHDGQASCQEPHGHGDETTEHDHASGSETGHGHDSASGTGHAHDSGSEAGTGADTGLATDSGDDATSGASVECEAYCGCLTMYCSEYEAHPHADEAACLAACGELSSDVLTCFSGFCEDAAAERSASLREHYCEHAWGELGKDEC